MSWEPWEETLSLSPLSLSEERPCPYPKAQDSKTCSHVDPGLPNSEEVPYFSVD